MVFLIWGGILILGLLTVFKTHKSEQDFTHSYVNIET